MQVIYADNVQTINEVMYAPRSDTLLNDLRSGLNNFNPSILTEMGRQYSATIQQDFEAVSGWKVVNAARKAAASLQGFDSPDVILPLTSFEQFQTAPLIMQRFIMSDTEIRQMHQKHRIDGWSDTYKDLYPGKIGEDHYDHRLAMSGVVVRTEQEEGPAIYSVTEYSQQLQPNEVKLSHSNKLDIRRTSLFARTQLKRGLQDLTDLYGGEVS